MKTVDPNRFPDLQALQQNAKFLKKDLNIGSIRSNLHEKFKKHKYI